MKTLPTVERNGQQRQRALVVGRWGFSGKHSHICEVEFVDKDTGMPWAKREVYYAQPLCNAGKGRHQAHGISWTAELNRETVTCEACRKFRCLNEE